MRFVYYTLAHHRRKSPTPIVLVSSYEKKILETAFIIVSHFIPSFRLSLFFMGHIKYPLLVNFNMAVDTYKRGVQLIIPSI
jgi:hypothetical protein